jgi:pilus assembly protein Flp/PilA
MFVRNLLPRESLRKMAQGLAEFLKDESGPTAVEYAVMLALIIVVAIGAVITLGGNVNATFGKVNAAFAGS